MGRLIFAMNVSLDGFIEGLDGDLNWTNPDVELHQHFNDLERSVGLMLYGRRLYENMAAYWPTAAENPAALPVEIEYAHIWTSTPKIVFSTSLDQVDWNSRLVREIDAEEIRRLKAQPGGYLSVGGAGLASSFSQLGLIDEYWIYIHPVILGQGKPMFGELQERINLQLMETFIFKSGVVRLRYARRVEG